MRFPEHTTLTLVNQRYEPPHVRCYCAAIATAVVGVVGAGVAAKSAMDQKKATEDAQQQSKDNASAIYGTKVQPVEYKSHVNLPQYDPNLAGEDYGTALPMLSDIAGAVTRRNMKLRDNLTGGMASANLNQAGVNAYQMQQGNLPTSVVDRVNRLVAQRSGGAFNPAGGAGQMASEDFARSIGTTAYDVMTKGMTYAPQWESLVDSFTYKPQQALGDALTMMRARNDYAKTQMELDQNQYIGQLNYQRTLAGKDPSAAGQFSDQLTLGTLAAKQQQNQNDAYAGLLKSGIGLATSLRKDTSDPYNDQGYIKQDQLAQVAASYKTPGYDPTFSVGKEGAYFTGYTG